MFIRVVVMVFLLAWVSCKTSRKHDLVGGYTPMYQSQIGPSEDFPEECSPLIATYWHQYEPFNSYICRKIGRKDAVAGCVIVTLAQLINYHKVFYSGKTYPFGAINSYLNKPLDNFPRSRNKSYVSEFIRDITVNKHLSTYIEDGYALYVYIKSISPFLNSVGYQAHADSFDIQKIKRYLSAGNPVIVFAEIDDGRSHVWLIDGYKDYSRESLLYEPLLHVNWGWGVNYQNGIYEDGWNRSSQIGYSKYRKVNFNKKTTVIYVSKKL